MYMNKHVNFNLIILTCPSYIGINNELLARLSNEDISITFDLQKMAMVRQMHNTWYKSGMLVDLACDQTSNVLQQV